MIARTRVAQIIRGLAAILFRPDKVRTSSLPADKAGMN